MALVIKKKKSVEVEMDYDTKEILSNAILAIRDIIVTMDEMGCNYLHSYDDEFTIDDIEGIVADLEILQEATEISY